MDQFTMNKLHSVSKLSVSLYHESEETLLVVYENAKTMLRAEHSADILFTDNVIRGILR